MNLNHHQMLSRLCEQALKQQEAAFVPEVEEEEGEQALPDALHIQSDQDMRQPLSSQQQPGSEVSMAAGQSAPVHVTAGDAAPASQNGAAPAAAVLEEPSREAASAVSKASGVSCLLHI